MHVLRCFPLDDYTLWTCLVKTLKRKIQWKKRLSKGKKNTLFIGIYNMHVFKQHIPMLYMCFLKIEVRSSYVKDMVDCYLSKFCKYQHHLSSRVHECKRILVKYDSFYHPLCSHLWFVQHMLHYPYAIVLAYHLLSINCKLP